MRELNVYGISFAQMTDESLDAVIEAAQEEKKNRRAARANELWNKLNDVFNEIAEAGFKVTGSRGWNIYTADDFAIEYDKDD